jgi:AbrB family looped-hinge helix DNA binding protein
MHITEKGQVTIPIKLRKRYGLDHNVEVEFFADEDGIRIAKRGSAAANPFRALRGAARKRLDAQFSVDKYVESIRGR